MKKSLYIQIILLALTVALGSVLYMHLSDGPRLLHRLAGEAAGVVALVTVVLAVRASHTFLVKALTVLAFVLVLAAGAAGSHIKTAADYSLALNTMRFSGALALVVSIFALWASRNPKK